MPLRALLKYLVNNEQLIQKLAESYPVRRAAQMAVSVFYKGKEKMETVDPQKVSMLVGFFKRFSQNLKQGIEDAKKQIKK